MRKKNWKRLMAFAMSAAMLVPVPMAYAAEGETAEQGLAAYAESRVVDADGFEIEDGVLKKYTGTDTEVVIPEGVTSIGYNAFYDCSGLISVSIPEGVTSIDDSAFYNCGSLTSVNIPEGVTSIGGLAFYGCSGLAGVSIPESVTSIGELAFHGCSGLESMKVENGNEVYDSRENCNAIIETGSNKLLFGCNNTVIPEGVTSIENSAFEGCSGLTSVNIPEGVTSIGKDVFSGCSGLTSITIPEGVTSIGEYAFHYCSGLTSVSLPKGVTSIEEGAFVGCSGLTSVSIPESVTSIGNYAFFECRELESISIPEGVMSIGDGTFYQCHGLTSVSIPKGVTSIGKEAFRNCGLVSVIIPEGVMSIGNSAFHSCYKLTSVSIPGSVMSINDSAFYQCSRLESVNIPGSVTSIGGSAFYNCGSLTSVIIPEGVTSIGDSVFYNCGSLTSINIPEGVTSIGDSAFYQCSRLESVSIPGSVTSIGNSAFYGCGLTSVNIPESVMSIGGNAFQCSGLESVEVEEGNEVYDSREECNAIIETERNELLFGCNNTVIPESVTSIGEYAFSYCGGLTSVIIPEGVKNIGYGAFFVCSNLESISIPGSVTSIGNYAFSDCIGLTSISIPEGVTSIGGGAFNNCRGLESVEIEEGNEVYDSREECNAIIETERNELVFGCKNTVIPEGVKSIGDYAFFGCRELQRISIPQGVTSIGELAFYDCRELTSISIPESVTNILESAFLSCSEALTIYGTKGSYAETYATQYNIKFSTGELSDSEIIISQTSYVYDGTAKTPEVTVMDGSKTLTEGEDYTVSYEDNMNVGTAKVIITGKGNYTGSVTRTFTITIKELSQCEILIITNTYVYDGTVKMLDLILRDGNKILTEGTDYTVDYKDNVNVGTAEAIITGKGNYTGLANLPFFITGKELSKCEITVSPTSYVYDGTAKTPAVTVKDGSKTLTEGEDYTVSYKYNVNVGTARAIITGKENYTGTVTSLFTITEEGGGEPEAKELSKCEITVSPASYVYDGTAKTPAVTVKDGSKPLTEGKDYTVSYEDNVNAGTAKAVITGKGNYTGTVTKTFTITKADTQEPEVKELSQCEIMITPGSYVYDGTAKTPAITVKDKSKTLTEDEDYTVSYEDNVNAGTAKVIITGKGNYTGTVTKIFTITEESGGKTEEKKISQCTISLSQTSYAYDGKAKTPAITVKDGSKTLTKGTDYTVAYKNNVNAGMAKAVITGKGNYTGSVTKTFTITVKKGTSHIVGAYKYQVTGASTVSITGVGKTSTTKVKVPKTVNIGGKTFKVTAIGKNAFKKNKKITSVEIGDNVTVIEFSAFEGCTKLSKATVGKGVTEIGAGAFKGCAKLGTITIKSTKLKKAGKNALKGIKATAKVKVPAKKLAAYQRLLKNKGQGKKVKIVK